MAEPGARLILAVGHVVAPAQSSGMADHGVHVIPANVSQDDFATTHGASGIFM